MYAGISNPIFRILDLIACLIRHIKLNIVHRLFHALECRHIDSQSLSHRPKVINPVIVTHKDDFHIGVIGAEFSLLPERTKVSAKGTTAKETKAQTKTISGASTK